LAQVRGGGYAFAKYDFPGKHYLFNFILGSIMVPSTALVLPLFLMLYRLGLVNTIWGVILPSLVNPFGLYLMRVFWNASFPNELIEAERVSRIRDLGTEHPRGSEGASLATPGNNP
jgi:multiple sugar transport system permease protein